MEDKPDGTAAKNPLKGFLWDLRIIFTWIANGTRLTGFQDRLIGSGRRLSPSRSEADRPFRNARDGGFHPLHPPVIAIGAGTVFRLIPG
ncbi:hypothetical protein CUJ86_11560 [Methanofollis fontis]|uniref:Uncharacterized protein n=1 Tax=Methanofollis fontis TaxID=2052832 RepID=A0A483CWM2_9EURY|nr:hypothetical protein CUJ86_11560 [Methanofollis fontis]